MLWSLVCKHFSAGVILEHNGFFQTVGLDTAVAACWDMLRPRWRRATRFTNPIWAFCKNLEVWQPPQKQAVSPGQSFSLSRWNWWNCVWVSSLDCSAGSTQVFCQSLTVPEPRPPRFWLWCFHVMCCCVPVLQQLSASFHSQDWHQRRCPGDRPTHSHFIVSSPILHFHCRFDSAVFSTKWHIVRKVSTKWALCVVCTTNKVLLWLTVESLFSESLWLHLLMPIQILR